MELALFALWCFIVAAAGGLVGLVLGNIRLPATLLVASGVAAGTGANLIVSAAGALTAAVVHARAGRVNWRLFAWMAPPSAVFAVLGGWLSGTLPVDVVLGAISGVLLVSALQLLRARGAAPARGRTEPDLAVAAASGAAVGLLGGFVGLILGSLRMPALLRLVGEAPARAAGTNVAVGVVVGVAGALGHLPSEAPDWTVAAVGCAASVPGALVGARLTGRLGEAQLVRAIALVLLVAAAATAAQAVT